MLNAIEEKANLELELRSRVSEHLSIIYPNLDTTSLAADFISEMGMGRLIQKPTPHRNHWDQGDVILITYGNTIKNDNELPLVSLSKFLDKYLSLIHI